MSTERQDPLTTFCFRVTLETVPGLVNKQAFFKSVTGLQSEAEVVDYGEGGMNGTTHRLVGRSKWPNLVLKRGFCKGTSGQALMKWRFAWLDDAAGTPLKRISGVIEQLDSKLNAVCTWKFTGGWPCKWVGPEFDASKQELAIETLEIAHEGLTVG